MRTTATASRAVSVALLLSVVACSQARDPIVVHEGIITIENQTSRDWRDVRVTVNDHFFGGAPSLAAGGRMNAPLSMLATSFGQRFDRGRMSVRKIEVTATASDGHPVKLEWTGAPRFR